MNVHYKGLLKENEEMIKQHQISGDLCRMSELLTHRALLKDWYIQELEQQLSLKLQSVKILKFKKVG